MPHVIIELSSQLDFPAHEQLLTAINTILYDSGQFGATKDIKSRIYRAQTSLIGTNIDDGEHFVVAHLVLLPGRHDGIKVDLANRIMITLQAHISPHVQNVQYAVDVRELSKSYIKAVA